MSVFNTISPNDWADSANEMSRYTYKNIIIYPKCWQNYPDRVKNLTWDKVKFDVNGLKNLPDDKKGIYSFFAEPQIANHSSVGYLLYIGETHDQTLRARCSSYLSEYKKKNKRVHICEMINRWPEHLWIHYSVINEESQIQQLEEDLIAAFLPPFNRKFPASISKIRKAALS